MSLELHSGVRRYIKRTRSGQANPAFSSYGTLSYIVDEYDKDDLWQYYTYGTGNMQCNLACYLYFPLSSSSASFDLHAASTGTLYDNFGRKLRFDTIKWFFIKNHSTANNLWIFTDSVANPWTSMVTPLPVYGLVLTPSGEFFMSSPYIGYSTTTGNSKVAIDNYLSATVNVEISIAGCGTIVS